MRIIIFLFQMISNFQNVFLDLEVMRSYSGTDYFMGIFHWDYFMGIISWGLFHGDCFHQIVLNVYFHLLIFYLFIYLFIYLSLLTELHKLGM